jgi:alcohol dehydrogenase class IV
VLGGMYDAPHGALCACLLPHVTVVNTTAMQARDPQNPALARYQAIAEWITGQADTQALADWLTTQIEVMQISPLSAYGVSESDFPTLIERSSRANSMKGNPIVLTPEEMEQILHAAL